MRSLSKALYATLLTTLHLKITTAQNCYYPNGNVTTGPDAACSSDGGVCCPYQWECMSNGLCYNPGADIFGRYTCTDETWQSSSCPQLCTQGNTASGDEALLQCSDGSWCCDGDRSFDCCSTADTDFFQLPQGTSYASITSVPSPTSVSPPKSANSAASTSETTPTTSSGVDQQQTTSAGTSRTTSSITDSSSSTTASLSSRSQSSATAGQASSTITSHAITTNTDGSLSTMVVYSTVSVAAVASAAPDSSHSSAPSHLGLIVGLAVGIPVFLLACAIVAFLLWRRRRPSKKSGFPSSRNSEEQPAMGDKFGHQVGYVAPDGRAPEIDSFPVALGRSKSGHKSELEGSLHSPAMSNGSPKPPLYSPVTPSLNAVQEEPAELWGGYVPYRPPRAELPEAATT
ncbi:hypothetical protein LTR10_002754 [Elasticomyces elasticus]|nr:hypothetical protein LTR10_002754 [Elasticomyces elasticus]KAK4967906.1 hypothetical protein LTR42_010234 [Elasticomyces elasticus]